MKGIAVNNIIIPTEPRYIREVSSKILLSLTSLNIDENRIFDIKLCIEEALRNAMVHGNKSDKKLSVKINYWVDDNDLNVEIEDGGKGFNPNRLEDPTENHNLLKTSGRGVYLIKRLMDRVEYNEKGNKVRMVKKLK